MEGKDGRTEKPTARRRSKARQDGQLAKSQEINTVVVLFLGLIALGVSMPYMGGILKGFMNYMMTYHVGETWSSALMQRTVFGVFGVFMTIMLPIAVPIMIGALVANVAQTKPYYSTKPLAWKFNVLNPVKGAKQLFSAQSLVTFAMSMLKVALVTTVLYVVMRSRAQRLVSLQYMEVRASAVYIFKTVLTMAWAVAALAIIIAILDYIYQKRKHEKQLMMTKEEVKEERKSQEPNPQIKKNQMKKMRELTMLRMMAAVPDSTVVVTNPTHVAVALQYDPETMTAPKVVAKGLRLVAERIKRIARENDIPIIEKPPLARSLYKEVKVGREVPSSLYGAIAELLAYLYKIGNSRIREKLSATKAA
jgi:flagellar biosynthetic protein FlhB